MLTGYMDVFQSNLEYYWQYMLDNYSEFTIHSVFTLGIHLTTFWLSFLPWFIIDQIPYFRKYKLQPDKSIEWKAFKRCLIVVLFNQLFVQSIMIYFFHHVVTIFGFSSALPLPSFTTIAWKIPVFFVIEDFYFYWGHRFLHWKKIYGYIHKMHHEYAAPFGIAAECMYLLVKLWSSAHQLRLLYSQTVASVSFFPFHVFLSFLTNPSLSVF